MPFPFACPECGLETLVDDEFTGHSGPCAGCGKIVTVPLYRPTAVPAAAPPRSRSAHRRNVILLVVAGIVAATFAFSLLLWLVFPVLRLAGVSVQKMSCQANIERIAQALRQYEIDHGTLPPAFIPDAAGKPMHSWRVLILPQLGEHGLHARYRFDEPWDGPANSQLLKQMPEVYGCPADPDARAKGETSYMVLVGPRTLFPGSTPVATRQVRDDHALTILVAEVPVAGTAWMQPKDLDATRMKFGVNGAMTGEIGSFHPRGAYAVMLDGTARFLSELLADEYVRAMSTANGGEDVPLEALD
jgi:hypothetical protein